MTKLVAGGIAIFVFMVTSYILTGVTAGKTSDPSNGRNKAAVKTIVPSSTQPAKANSPTSRPANESNAKGALDALRQAAKAKKHLYVFVHEKDDEQTRAGRMAYDAAVRKLGDVIQWIAIDRSTASESAFVKEYGLNAAPMPIAIVFAPNGAIVGGFLGAKLTEPQLLDALASPGMQAVLKALQDRKLVFLCAQNGSTKLNDKAMKGINEFKADARYAKITEIIKIDPLDSSEKKFLAQLQVDQKMDQATTILLAPPGKIVGKFNGATEKKKLVAALESASSGGCSGKTGCCPPKK